MERRRSEMEAMKRREVIAMKGSEKEIYLGNRPHSLAIESTNGNEQFPQKRAECKVRAIISSALSSSCHPCVRIVCLCDLCRRFDTPS